MDIVDIYGYLPDKSEIVIAAGNYNNIHGILCYQPINDLLQIRPLPEINVPSITELILNHETPIGNKDKNKLYFSLTLKEPHDEKQYINVKIESTDKNKIACAVLSSEKAIFTIAYSNIDKNNHGRLLSGSLYSLATMFGEQNYTVSWKIQDFDNGDLVIFLPTSWYESQPSGFCEKKEGMHNLISLLNQPNIRGYTEQIWCENIPSITNCQNNIPCGNCMGQCPNPNHLCYPNPTNQNFVCRSPGKEPNIGNEIFVTFTTEEKNNTGIAWFAIVSIFVVFILLAIGFFLKSRQ